MAGPDNRTLISHVPSRAIDAGDRLPSEKTYFEETLEHVHRAYSMDNYGTWVTSYDGKMQVLTDYDPFKLSSSRVLSVLKGTVFTDIVLLIEQVFITLVFFSVAMIPIGYNNLHIYLGLHKEDRLNESFKHFVIAQEEKMRAFAMIMSGLAAFLLSFYTSLLVGRWWVIRSQGIGGIKAATVDLELLISQNCTRDEQVLGAVRRYGRASLMLIFLWRRKELDCLREVMVKRRGVLSEDEADQLLEIKHCWHETIWAWKSEIVATLYKEKKISSDNLFCLLLEKCLSGRAAAQCVHTHLAVKIQMQYVHLLGFLVKAHNFILAVIMGSFYGIAYVDGSYIICAQTFGRTLILPFLFNAILLINARLSDPFDGHSTSFPAGIYEQNLQKDCDGIVKAGETLPLWLKEKRSKAEQNV